MDQDAYFQTVKRCCSPEFFPETWHASQLQAALINFAAAAQRLDKAKKALFYGNTKHARPDPHPAEVFVKSGFNHRTLHKDVLHAIIGIATEAGEMAERLLAMGDMARQDEAHDKNLFEEAGDLEWYQSLLYGVLGFRQADVRLANDNKLRVRYPERFSSERAEHRDLGAEKLALDHQNVDSV